jgi:hypothetical protein
VYKFVRRSVKRSGIPNTGQDRPTRFQEVQAPRFQDSRHMKVVRLLALRPGRPNSLVNIPCTHFRWRRRFCRKDCVKSSSDTLGNRTRDLPASSAVPLDFLHIAYILRLSIDRWSQLHNAMLFQVVQSDLGLLWHIFLL